MDESPEEDLSVDELLGWAEFCCWSALVMAPVIYWIQGPSVSNDQYIVRSALVVIVSVGALILRGRALLLKRKNSAGISQASHNAPTETEPLPPVPSTRS